MQKILLALCLLISSSAFAGRPIERGDIIPNVHAIMCEGVELHQQALEYYEAGQGATGFQIIQLGLRGGVCEDVNTSQVTVIEIVSRTDASIPVRENQQNLKVPIVLVRVLVDGKYKYALLKDNANCGEGNCQK